MIESFGLKDAFTVGLLDNKHILMRFNHEEGFQRIWLQEQWYFKKFLMQVFKWTPEFRVDAESTIAPIWVKFPHLPIHFFSKHSLFSILVLGSALGCLMKMDAATAAS